MKLPWQLILEQVDLEKFTEALGYTNAPLHKAIYEKLSNSEVKRLLIIMPPGHGKSTCATVNYTLWAVGCNPNLRIIVASHTRDFVASFIREITAQMSSDEYIRRFGDLKPVKPNKWTQNELIVNRTVIQKDPTFTALGTEQATIGRRADIIICDDIIDEDYASSEVLRQSVKTWFKKELLTRLEPEGRVVVIGTRWHFADLYDDLLKEVDENNKPLWERLVFPVWDESMNVLWPEKWPLETILARKAEIGSVSFSAQYLCDPTPIEGAIFKAGWLHYWHETNEDPAKHIFKLPPFNTLRIYQGWDLAISEDPTADWTVGVTLGFSQDGYAYLLDYYRGHLDFPAQIKQVEAQAAAWKPYRIAIEANAYQLSLPQWLRQGLLPVVAIKQSKNKVARLTELAPYFENGTIRINPKHEELLLEYLQFPKGAHDDILDALHIAFSTAKEPPLVVTDLFGP